MIKSFKSFTEERTNGLVVTFGRYNPPTVGHEKLFDAVAKIAKGKMPSHGRKRAKKPRGARSESEPLPDQTVIFTVFLGGEIYLSATRGPHCAVRTSLALATCSADGNLMPAVSAGSGRFFIISGVTLPAATSASKRAGIAPPTM